MKLGGLGTAGRAFRSLFEGGATAGLTDGQLLDRFSNGRDEAAAEAAFDALVARHGPMVWGACRRILRDTHAAEDAFQATFLVLVRKAGSVRVDDTLGRWLHGVGVRVALRARADAARRPVDGLSGVEPSVPPIDPGLDDLRAAIDEEVNRLPSAYRSVVVLCHLEGLTRERAAGRLGCPVGTVNSRLSRASELLRNRLARRGFAPASAGLAAWFSTSEASAMVPPNLVAATVAASVRYGAGGTLVGVVPAGVVALVVHSSRGTLMIKTTMAGTLLVGLGIAAFGSLGANGGDPVVTPTARPDKERIELVAPPPTLDERVKAAKAEWDAARAKYFADRSKAKTDTERLEVETLNPKVTRYADRFIALADTEPKSPAARDALLWVVGQGWIFDGSGNWSQFVGRAMDRLIEHHADDLGVAWACLSMEYYTSPNRDRFIPAVYEQARSKRTRGAAALALAQYRWKMSLEAFGRKLEVAPVAKTDTGEILPMSPEMSAYLKLSYERDPAPLRLEAFRLLDEVIRDHPDEPYDAKKGTTLGQKARDLFDEWANLAIGKTSPDFEGKDLEGRSIKLSDYRGKVVALVFWASWCGPCVAEIPHERELAERFKDRPFAFLGVNCDEDREAARKVVLDQKISWANVADVAKQVGPCEIDFGPIAGRYHVSRLPSVFLIDAKGTIRHKEVRGKELDQVVAELLNEMSPGADGSK